MNTSAAVFSFRPMVYADIPLFRDWISRSHIAQWWHDSPSTVEINAWCSIAVDEGRHDWHHIALLNGSDPVGFIQTYTPLECHRDGWWSDEHDPGVRGIDQFLANVEQLGLGHGTTLIRDFTVKLFGDPAVTRIQCDPAPDNHRAIRCYEKAGFHAVREIVTPDGPALLMYCERR